jgi:hypothetical protein
MDQEYPSTEETISFEKHYHVFKSAEKKVIAQLGRLDHEEFLIGLRVAYDVPDSTNEPDVLPNVVEFGYLGPVDSILQCSQIDEETGELIWQATTSSGVSVHPLPREFLDRLLDETKAELEEGTGLDLRVGVFAVLYGSPTKTYSVSCTCAGKRKRYCCYNPVTKTNSCYCTTKGC